MKGLWVRGFEPVERQGTEVLIQKGGLLTLRRESQEARPEHRPRDTPLQGT